MKILVPILGFGRGGGNRVLSELGNYWIKAGHEVSYLCLDGSSEPYFSTNGKIYWVNKSGDIVLSNDTHQKRGIFTALIDIRRLVKGIKNMSEKHDVILANQALTSIAAYFSNTVANKYYYIQAYEAGYNFYHFNLKNYIMGAIVYFTYKLPLIRIVNSPIYFKYKNISAEYYIPPGVDFDKFYPQISERKNGFVLGCIGRLEKFKGTLDVYEAFKGLIERGIDVCLHVAYGDINNYDEQYRHLITIVKPANDVELGAFYRSLDILIAVGTVQFYAHHYPVMEAMASKIPVITTGYLPADRSNAWIVGPYSPNQIVDTVIEIKNNYQTALAKSELAFKNIQYYNWVTIAKDFIKIFEFNNRKG